MKIFDDVYIKVGDEIDIETGYLYVEDFNGSIVTCEEYSYDDDHFIYFEGVRRLTLYEIARLLKDVDGYDHNVFWNNQEG